MCPKQGIHREALPSVSPGQAGSFPFHSPVQLGEKILPKTTIMLCSNPFPLLSPPGGCVPLDGFSLPSQSLTTLQVCSQTLFILFLQQKFWVESSSRTVCQDGGRRLGKESHITNTLGKSPFYLLKEG